MKIGIIGAILLAFFILTASARPVHAAEQDFLSWREALRQEALQYGISDALFDAALPESFQPNERVIRLDRQQPEHKVTFGRYKKNVITEGRLRDGRLRMQQHEPLLHEISNAYGVEPQYIVALWGIETSFGRNTGGFEIIPALATLAYDGRRGDFFRQELLKALKIVEEGHIPLDEMKGSWAGAMGQCQFMPTSFEKYARDHDRDGRRDIWNTKADVFASAAAYLSESGWQKGQPWGRRVALPQGFDPALLGLKVQQPIQFWRQAGVRLFDGQELPAESSDLASIIQPGGPGHKSYIVYGNYRIIMKWNNSIYFATAVGHFADLLK